MTTYQNTKYELGADPIQSAYRQGKRGDVNAVAVGSIATVLTPTSGKRLVFLGGDISVSAAASVLFEDNSAGGGTIFRTPVLAQNVAYQFDLGVPYSLSAINNVLKATSSAGANLTGTLYYAEI